MNALVNKTATFINAGLIDYKAAWDYQTELFNTILARKNANRTTAAHQQQPTDNYIIFCEHPHVYTLGKSGQQQNLLIDETALQKIDATYYHINRGGDITYHGPGQLVCYPVIDLENFFTDIHRYMRLLEQSVIDTLNVFRIEATRIAGLTGVWVMHAGVPKKICAMGVKSSRWVMMHGLALNVSCDLTYFNNIIACGITDKAVTSMEEILQQSINMEMVQQVLKEKIATYFEIEWI